MSEERKPDFENESLRVWSTNKKDISENMKKAKEEGFELEIEPGMKVSLMGFSKIKDKKGNVLFAWKIKPNFVLYYVNPDIEKAKEISEIPLNLLRKIRPLQSVFDAFKAIKSEKHIIEKLGKKKKKSSKTKGDNN